MMFIKSTIRFLLSATFAVLLSVSSVVSAADVTGFSGVVSQIQGKRAEILLDAGGTVWISMPQSMSGVSIGDRAQGSYRALGDTMLAEEVVFE